MVCAAAERDLWLGVKICPGANQRPVFRSRDLSWPIRGQYSAEEVLVTLCESSSWCLSVVSYNEKREIFNEDIFLNWIVNISEKCNLIRIKNHEFGRNMDKNSYFHLYSHFSIHHNRKQGRNWQKIIRHIWRTNIFFSPKMRNLKVSAICLKGSWQSLQCLENSNLDK